MRCVVMGATGYIGGMFRNITGAAAAAETG